MKKNNIDWRKYYKVGNKLGKGKFGEVYEATTKNSKEKRAVKVLNKQKIREALKKNNEEPTKEQMMSYIQCFKNEVNNMKSALGKNEDNENAVKLYEYYENENEFAIIMECCDTNLLEYINKVKEEEKFHILTQLNKTLKIMAETGQVFIDLRIENILIKFTNEKKNDYIVKLKLTDDTGLTKQFQNLDKSQEDNEHIHTDAPEILNKEDFNEKSDLWSLGVIIYFLYFKEYPYEGKSSSEILAQIKKGQSELKKSGNSDLDDLIRGLLKEETENRINWNQYFTHQFFNKKNDGSKNYTDFYEIEKVPIGHTDNATIFKAKDKDSGELKAIKVFDFNRVKNDFISEYLREPTEEELKPYKDSFTNEFEHMKIIKGENNENNNTVKVYDSYENQNEFAVIMELCDNNLLHILAKSKSFSANEIGDVLSQLNNSFKIMNEKKLIHRDINLENILVKYENGNKTKFTYKLKLTNNSCFLKDISKSNILDGNNIRNFRFKAPEIIKNKDSNEKCDLWSLGEVIYVLAFHEYLFSKNKDEKLKQIKNIKKHLTKRTSNPELDDLIRKLLVEDPDERMSWEGYFKHPFIRQKENFSNYYQLEDLIAKTRFAKIYKAKSKEENELRAIKIYDINKIKKEFKIKNCKFPTEKDLKPYINGLNNEIKNMKKLMGKDENNNNAVKYFEHFYTNNKFAIVMELCDENLQKFYDRMNNSFNPSRIKQILDLLNKSFTIMNDNNIIHRALNLENILIKYIDKNKKRYNLKIKITNDSLVKDLPEITKKEEKNSYKLFLAPEILKEEKNIEKCDLWSLGVIIYYLSNRDYPFKGNTKKIIKENIQANAKNLKINTSDSNLNDLIKQLLVEDPDERISWDDYFNHPFFGKKSENFDDSYKIINIDDPIDETDSATVYKGEDKKTGELRAIKIFSKRGVPQEQINSFYNEGKHMKLIQGSDYTVKVYKTYDEKDRFIIVMELCDDTLLNKYIERDFTSEEIYNLLTQLNVSFKRMANKNLVHRALNLENILIKYNDKDEESYIYKLKMTIDSSSKKGSPTIRNSDETPESFKSFKFVAPEILNQEEFDEKSDLWSLGVIIYILLFKNLPFDGEDINELLEKINSDKNNLEKAEDENLDDLIKKLLVRDPKNRLTWNEYFEHPFFKNEPFINI